MSDQTTVVTPQPTTGLPEQTSGSQATSPGVQTPVQPQTVGPAQGREPDSQDSSNGDGEKSKPSEFYENRREVRTLRNSVSELQQMVREQQQRFETLMQRSASPPAQVSTPPWKDPNQFFANPAVALEALRQEMRQEITNEVMGRVPQTISAQYQELETQRQMQEALNLLSTNEAVRTDPRGRDKIEDLLFDPQYGLNEFSKLNPIGAAKLALEIFNARNGRGMARNPLAPTKSQLTSTATGVATPAGQTNWAAESQKLQQEIVNNPNIVHDPAFKIRYETFMTQYKTASQNA